MINASDEENINCMRNLKVAVSHILVNNIKHVLTRYMKWIEKARLALWLLQILNMLEVNYILV